MAAFRPVTTGTPLEIGTTIETEVFELKLTIAGYRNVDCAIMVAQLANSLGGTVIVGAEEVSGRLARLRPMSDDEEARARQQISDGVQQCCVPHPMFGYVLLPREGGSLLAVNIEPSVTGPVGVKVQTTRADSGYGGTSYAFPIRIGNAGGFIDPDNLHLYMLPELRRLVIGLNAIPVGAPIYVGSQGGGGHEGRLVSVTIEQTSNRVKVALRDGMQIITWCSPLTSVIQVFRRIDDTWVVFLGDWAKWSGSDHA